MLVNNLMNNNNNFCNTHNTAKNKKEKCPIRRRIITISQRKTAAERLLIYSAMLCLIAKELMATIHQLIITDHLQFLDMVSLFDSQMLMVAEKMLHFPCTFFLKISFLFTKGFMTFKILSILFKRKLYVG